MKCATKRFCNPNQVSNVYTNTPGRGRGSVRSDFQVPFFFPVIKMPLHYNRGEYEITDFEKLAFCR